MNRQPNRLPAEAAHGFGGSALDRTQPLRFRVDGRSIDGFAGDTVLSAVLAAVVVAIKALGRLHLALQVRDRELREKVTPNFEIGCKRILLSNTWYPALARENVDLVTAPIERVTADGIVTADGVDHPADVLVVATGFHVTDSPFFERVRGSDGRRLADKWADEGMEAYKGTTVAGYPNLFVLVGPATGLGHSSMIYMIESQLRYVVDRSARPAVRLARDRSGLTGRGGAGRPPRSRAW